MKIIIAEKLARIIKNRRKLETQLNVKITNRGKEVSIQGDPENEYVAEKVIDALEFGFPFSTAMLIEEENLDFQIINIKDHTKRHDLERVRGRIIGKGGKTLKTLSLLTKCFFEIKENQIGIVGDSENLPGAEQGLIFLIKGSKQGNVYKFLEKHQVREPIDLGLKK
ncbi:MAG: hypothetical protein AABX88_01700 [Nanoarchaeota archaeon]